MNTLNRIIVCNNMNVRIVILGMKEIMYITYIGHADGYDHPGRIKLITLTH